MSLRGPTPALLGCTLALIGCTSPSSDWVPERGRLLFMSKHGGDSDIYLTTGTDTAWTNLTDHPGGDNWPVWSPDGNRIAFQSTRSGNLDIWLMNADGSNPVQLTRHEDHDYLPSWTPDGRSICFTSWRTEEDDTARAPHFYTMRVDGSQKRRLIESSPMTSTGVAWSADGSRVVYTRKTEQGGALVLAETRGWTERELTAGDDYCGAAVFSPDGERLAFYAATDSSSDIVVMHADGSGRRALVRGGWNYYPRWSPNGRWLLYCALVPDSTEDNYDLYAVELEGNRPPILLAGGPGRQVEGSWQTGHSGAISGQLPESPADEPARRR